MPVPVKIGLDKKQFDRAVGVLGKKRVGQIAAGVIKEFLPKAKKIVADEVKAKTTLRPKYIQRVIASRVQQGEPPVGVITVSKKQLPLAAYFFRKAGKSGVIVTISRDRGPEHFRHAFIATVRMAGTDDVHDGHRGVFVRARHLPSKGPNIINGKLTAKGFAGRFAIRELFGPAVTDILVMPDVDETVKARLESDLRKRFASKVNYFSSLGDK